jgi:hypothetical protein
MTESMKLDFDPQAIGERILNSLRPGLEAVGAAILEEANRHVPLAPDGGALKESGRVTSADDSVCVSYGTSYAVRLHEHPEYKFRDAPERGAKWLENAAKNVAPNAASIIAER